MKLTINEMVSKEFGENAKLVVLSNGMKNIIFHSIKNSLSRYDEIHLGKFISSGIYPELYKRLSVELGIKNRIIFEVEYSILKVCIVRRTLVTGSIAVLKRFSIGLFYGRSLDELCLAAKHNISSTLMCQINTEVKKVRHFFELFKIDELESQEDLDTAIVKYENLSDETLIKKDKALIERYVWKNL